jgi:hypothetical protein
MVSFTLRPLNPLHKENRAERMASKSIYILNLRLCLCLCAGAGVKNIKRAELLTFQPFKDSY